MLQINLFSRKDLIDAPAPNYWDILAFIFISSAIFAVAWLLQQMAVPFSFGKPINIDLNPASLPAYCLRSVMRICLALIVSLIFTFIFGAAAAKSKLAERIIIPSIDVLQSVPVLGFLSVGVWGFLTLFPGSLLGPECAAIFALFTAQVWNMTLSFYQSLCLIPKSLREASGIMHLSVWQRFWRLEVPYAMPSLLWNIMLSISSSWFFMVASEAIDVNNHVIMLPGVGSYIALAIIKSNMTAVSWAILAMLTTIIIYDQILFRPIMQWGEKFRPANHAEEMQPSFITKILSRARFVQFFFMFLRRVFAYAVMLPAAIKVKKRKSRGSVIVRMWPIISWVGMFFTFVMLLLSLYFIITFFSNSITAADINETLWLGAVSTFRIFILVVLCIIVWVPVGVWIGLRPYAARRIQPIIQILSAFPANLLFPFFATLIISYDLNKDIWLSPLMILGTQWYILFNVIAGTMSLPEEQKYAVASLGLPRLLWWRRFILPGLLPHLVTGAMTATGGAWNASIIAEAINWGGVQLYATGLGAYIAYHTKAGNSVNMALGIVVMCLYVLLINRVFWQPLYHFSQRHCQTEG
ncbi:MAG: ABC transporter permease subunit [Legionellales bacterium]|jgi:NitT/TauT family transport system permease protein|nr:ABC transporter permease subunit [Legionellales bacterium]